MTVAMISFSELCNKVLPAEEKKEKISEGQFVVNMLEACGCHHFDGKDYNGIPKWLFDGTRRFSTYYRQRCATVDIEKMTTFFSDTLKTQNNSVNVARRFSIPKPEKVEVRILSRALAYQLRVFIENTEKEDVVDNIVAKEYSKMRPGLGKYIPENEVVALPLYQGDNFELKSRREYACRCYQRMEYNIKIRNCGSEKWEERNLVLVGEPQKGVEISTRKFMVVDTRPDSDANFYISILHRNEGIYTYKWIMLNYEGEDCFPNRPDDISFTVDVSFQEGKS